MTIRLTSISNEGNRRPTPVSSLSFASALRDPQVSASEAARIDQSWAASIQRVCGHTADEKDTSRVRPGH